MVYYSIFGLGLIDIQSHSLDYSTYPETGFLRLTE
jgi:hypothetical protein